MAFAGRRVGFRNTSGILEYFGNSIEKKGWEPIATEHVDWSRWNPRDYPTVSSGVSELQTLLPTKYYVMQIARI